MPTIYLARHATPDWNRKDIPYDLPPGPPLVPEGEREAEDLGRFLLGAGVAAVYASPFARTQRTADIAGALAGVPIAPAVELSEVQRGEADTQIYARLQPMLARAWEEAAAAERPIALVTHGGAIRVVLEQLGVDSTMLWHYRRQFDHQNPAPPAGAWQLMRDSENGPITARFIFSPSPFTEYLPAAVYV